MLRVRKKLVNHLPLVQFSLHFAIEPRIEQLVKNLLELRPWLESHGFQILARQNRLHVLVGREEGRDLPLDCFSFALRDEDQPCFIG